MKLHLLLEGYGSVVNMSYGKAKTDPKPRVLLLGRWRHPDTRNVLVAGINLNYLDDEQILRLRQSLPEILKPKNLKSRYWRGRNLLPDIFADSYRTYDQDYLGAVTRDTLKFFKPDELEPPTPTPPSTPTPTAPTQGTAQEPKAPVAPAAQEPSAKDPATTPAPAAPADKAPAPATAPTAPPPTSAQKMAAAKLAPALEPDQEPVMQTTPLKPEEGPTTAPEKIETSPEPEAADQGDKAPDATLKPEVEKAPAKQRPVKPKTPKTPPDKQKNLTSAQRRQKKAESIKKALDTQKLTKPPVKPEPPDEIKGAMGLFKKKD